jgi:hypothetical protein
VGHTNSGGDMDRQLEEFRARFRPSPATASGD